MKKIALIGCFSLFLIGTIHAQNKKSGNASFGHDARTEAKESSREYSIIVYERQSDSPLSFDREISNGRSGNGFFEGIYDVYRSTFAGKIINLSSNFLGTGVNMLVKAFTQKRENQANWYSTTQREMTYTKKLPMQTEIADFYRKTSSIGAMDPEGMMFNGLGCRQYITYKDDDGSLKKILVFEIACSLDDSQRGKQRILHHGKFEIKVDSIRFNPYLCDLPNDSLNAGQVKEALRIPFDFERRKNLTFRLNANISSSWMNEAIEIFKDQPLGQFQVEFNIPDSTVLDQEGLWKGYYTYKSTSVKDQDNPKKNVRISGECFIVPRSFIGNYSVDDTPTPSTTPLWGTGQYRVDMQITETCQMNEQYYTSDDRWKEEWKKIKKRRHSPSIFNTFVDQAKNEFDWNNHKWVYTILDPVQSAILVDEEKWVNHIIIGDGDDSTSRGSSISTGSILSSSGMTSGGINPGSGGQKPQGKP